MAKIDNAERSTNDSFNKKLKYVGFGLVAFLLIGVGTVTVGAMTGSINIPGLSSKAATPCTSWGPEYSKINRDIELERGQVFNFEVSMEAFNDSGPCKNAVFSVTPQGPYASSLVIEPPSATFATIPAGRGRSQAFALTTTPTTPANVPIPFIIKVVVNENQVFYESDNGQSSKPDPINVILKDLNPGPNEAVLNIGSENLFWDQTVTSSPPGISCLSDCAQNYPVGTKVTLTAKIYQTQRFMGWSGAGGQCGTTNPCTLTLGSGTTKIVPNYKKLVRLAYHIYGQGSVEASPSGSLVDSCLRPYTGCQEYLEDTIVTLTPFPANGYKFTSWQDEGGHTCEDIKGPCTLRMKDSFELYANFSPNSGSGGGGGGQTFAACADGADNDGDNLRDYGNDPDRNDPGCDSASDNDEYNAPDAGGPGGGSGGGGGGGTSTGPHLESYNSQAGTYVTLGVTELNAEGRFIASASAENRDKVRSIKFYIDGTQVSGTCPDPIQNAAGTWVMVCEKQFNTNSWTFGTPVHLEALPDVRYGLDGSRASIWVKKMQ